MQGGRIHIGVSRGFLNGTLRRLQGSITQSAVAADVKKTNREGRKKGPEGVATFRSCFPTYLGSTTILPQRAFFLRRTAARPSRPNPISSKEAGSGTATGRTKKLALVVTPQATLTPSTRH